MKCRGAMIAVAGILVAGLPGRVWAGPPAAPKCQAAKNQEAGKYALCREKAEKKLISTAGTCSVTTSTECYRDAECPPGETCDQDDTKYNEALNKCEIKFGAKWTKLEQKAVDAGGTCTTTLDQDDIESLVTDRVDRVAWELSGTARFVDNGDGTITDRKTGLMWEKKVKLDTFTDPNNLQDADNFYLWANQCSVTTTKYCQPTAEASAACSAGVDGDATGCAECTGGEGTCSIYPEMTIWEWLVDLNDPNASFATYNDWRLPTREELVSIVDYAEPSIPVVNEALHGANCGSACGDIGNPACSCTKAYSESGQASAYSSASTVAPAEAYFGPGVQGAWYVEFRAGMVFPYYQTTTGWVRAVREAP